MANLRNEFEFRSALLTALGQEHTEAEAKNEDTWRRKMLDGLGVEYDQNDVNQFGLFREKLIEGVTKKSEGGGGESDFTKVNLTLEVRENEKFGNYRITLTDIDNNATSLKVGTTEGEPRYFDIDFFDVTVDYNSPVTEEIYLYQNNYFMVTEPSVHQLADFVVTGNAEAVEVEDEGNTVRLVKVYGDCAISVVGGESRK